MNEYGLFLQDIEKLFGEVIESTGKLDGPDSRQMIEDEWREFFKKIKEKIEIRVNKMDNDKQDLMRKWGPVVTRAAFNLESNSNRPKTDTTEEITRLNAQIRTLTLQLNPMDGLEWDGTLEDAAKKMGDLLVEMESVDAKIKREAQRKYLLYERACDTHPDTKRREEEKWEKWEKENKEKNLQALEEMKKIVPPDIATTASVESIMAMTGATIEIARRVINTVIFKLLYPTMTEVIVDNVSMMVLAHDVKTMVPDFLNVNYSIMGLDIRELRAVYSVLEKDIGSNLTRIAWRNNIRDTLYRLTGKEVDGILTQNETQARVYRPVVAGVVSPAFRSPGVGLVATPKLARTPIDKRPPLDMNKFKDITRILSVSVNKPPVIAWEKWETDNKDKNLKALEEMKNIVPIEIRTTASESSLMAGGLEKAVAKRVMQYTIFKLFYMTVDDMLHIHAPDLLNVYTITGLDIRELRAVYCVLPQGILEPPPQQKTKEWITNIRDVLFKMTESEKENKLQPNQKLAIAYRKVV